MRIQTGHIINALNERLDSNNSIKTKLETDLSQLQTDVVNQQTNQQMANNQYLIELTKLQEAVRVIIDSSSSNKK